LVCVEQPELHVHPAVQVGLGDLFIEGAVNQGLSFLIETHSEHLILRILRRIREAHEGGPTNDSLHVEPNHVAVHCLSKEAGVVKIERIPITPDGDFSKRWPQGFFDERGAELF
jgi:predicted ATPase